MQHGSSARVGKNTLHQAHAATSPARVRRMESQHGHEGAGKSLD